MDTVEALTYVITYLKILRLPSMVFTETELTLWFCLRGVSISNFHRLKDDSFCLLLSTFKMLSSSGESSFDRY